ELQIFRSFAREGTDRRGSGSRQNAQHQRGPAPLSAGLGDQNTRQDCLRTGWRRNSLGYSLGTVKGFGFEPNRWPSTPAGNAVAHSVDALDPICEWTFRVAPQRFTESGSAYYGTA